MHWFWRLIIAAAFGAFFGPVVLRVVPGLSPVFSWSWSWYWDQVFVLILPMLIPAGVSALLGLFASKDEPIYQHDSRSPLHWAILWGAALFVGSVVGVALGSVLIKESFYRPPFNVRQLISGLIMMAFIGAVPVGTYIILNRAFGISRGDRETRCRKCQYILKGISEPICPECGERI